MAEASTGLGPISGTSAALLLSAGSAIALAVAGVLSKRLTLTMPARQLIGPLLALNALLVLPGLPFTRWIWTPTTLALHGAEIALLVITSLAIWRLFGHGAASATVTAQSLSPLATTAAVMVLLPAAFHPWQAVAAVVVVGAVLASLSDAFPDLGRRRTLVTLTTAALGSGLLTVTSRLLADQGVGIVSTYAVRTTAAAVVMMALVPPRDVPLRQLPRLVVRAVFITAHYLLILVAIRAGSPAVVQTVVATAPLVIVAYESLSVRRAPPARLLAGALIAAAGVGLVYLG